MSYLEYCFCKCSFVDCDCGDTELGKSSCLYDDAAALINHGMEICLNV